MRTEFSTQAPLIHLRRRAELAQRLRGFFDERGFLEVQTPILSRWSIIDRHLDPIRVAGAEVLGGDTSPTWYLQTSPEQSMKRLLASNIGSIYQLGPVFRARERGQLHNPEFTMAEWYEVGASWAQGLATLDTLCQAMLGTKPADRIRFADAFQSHTGLEIFNTPAERLADWCLSEGLVERLDWSTDWDDWIDLIFSLIVQPRLGLEDPVLITHFPASQAALARLSEDDARTAERYELFYRGVELANGYHELLEATALIARAEQANAMRIQDGKAALPIDNPVLDAMRFGLPPACGCALGFDRLVMLACNASQLSEVIAFTSDRA